MSSQRVINSMVTSEYMKSDTCLSYYVGSGTYRKAVYPHFLIVRILLTLIYITFCVLLFIDIFSKLLATIFLISGLGLLIVDTLPRYNYWRLRKIQLVGDVSLQCDNYGLINRATGTRAGWSEVEQAKLKTRWIVIKLANIGRIVIPTSAFDSQSGLRSFQELLKRYISNRFVDLTA